MNSKKVLVAALTAAVAVSSAVSVSAIAPGVTTAATKQTAVVEPGKVTHFSITINDVTIDADVPADAVNAGEELTFGASTVTNVDIEAAIAAERTDVATSEILDVYFLDADGNNKSFENVGVDVTVTTTTTAYETIYIFEENTGLNELAKADGKYQVFSIEPLDPSTMGSTSLKKLHDPEAMADIVEASNRNSDKAVAVRKTFFGMYAEAASAAGITIDSFDLGNGPEPMN